MILKNNSKLNAYVQNQISQLAIEDQTWLMSIDEQKRDQVLTALACSDFICNSCQQQPKLLQSLFISLPSFDDYSTELEKLVKDVTNESQLMSVLRRYRNAQMAHIAFNDCLSMQVIEDSLLQVSALADALILQAYHWIYQSLTTTMGTPCNDQPLCIIAMGKLGGKELNFSSDIDLIFAYPQKGETKGGRKAHEHQKFFIRVAQKLIHVLDQVNTDGQVFRVDMRLRPYGNSGPLVMHFDAFADYYQEQARDWERFAMTKARILNEPNSYTKTLESIIQPFVYKRYLDFTTLDALSDMKQKIFADSRRKQLIHNIKLGEGGIREAEFFVQHFQLIHGGQNPQLQTKSWLTSLKQLVNGNYITHSESKNLQQSYLFLREVEHGLQQIRNEQTQTLPDSDNELDWVRLVIYTGSDDIPQLESKLHSARALINCKFNELLKDNNDEVQFNDNDLVSALQALWLSEFDRNEVIEVCSNHVSEKCIQLVADTLLSFKQKVSKAHLSYRAQQRVDKVTPLLLHECLVAKDLDSESISRVFSIVSAVLGRTTYLDLLHEYPHVRTQLVTFCLASPWIANQLKRFPLLLDELLSQAYLQEEYNNIQSCRADYEDELRQALLRVDFDDVDQHMDVLRQFKLCQQFRIAASDLHGSLPVEQVSDKLTVLAEVILSHVINTAYQHMEKKYGKPSHSSNAADSFAAMAYGKMGGYELGYGSDLDLVFIHNAPNDTYTLGSKSVSAQNFYIKMAQRIMHLLNTKTLLGELYEIDLRLRPSGNSGLLCCHYTGFAHYQTHEAWTWEHQALVRARVVFGGETITNQLNKIKTDTLSIPRNSQELIDDVVKMRAKLYQNAQTKTAKAHFKHGVGGITDIEFLSQYWVLNYAKEYKTITQWPDNLRIMEEAAKLGIISKSLAKTLTKTYLKQRNTLHHSVLTNKPLELLEPKLKEIRQETFDCWMLILPPYIHLKDNPSRSP